MIIFDLLHQRTFHHMNERNVKTRESKVFYSPVTPVDLLVPRDAIPTRSISVALRLPGAASIAAGT